MVSIQSFIVKIEVFTFLHLLWVGRVQYRREVGGSGVKLTPGPDEIRGPGRNQGARLAGKYYIEFILFITGIKNYCSCAISVSK